VPVRVPVAGPLKVELCVALLDGVGAPVDEELAHGDTLGDWGVELVGAICVCAPVGLGDGVCAPVGLRVDVAVVFIVAASVANAEPLVLGVTDALVPTGRLPVGVSDKDGDNDDVGDGVTVGVCVGGGDDNVCV
jgi:hypothetical protein